MQGSLRGDAFHLDDDDSAGVLSCLRHGERFQRQRLSLHGDVALLVGSRPTQQRDVDGKARKEQILLSFQFDDLDQLLGRTRVHSPALETRIDEGVQANRRDNTRFMPGDFPEQVGDHALREAIRLDLFFEREFAQRGTSPNGRR